MYLLEPQLPWLQTAIHHTNPDVKIESHPAWWTIYVHVDNVHVHMTAQWNNTTKLPTQSNKAVQMAMLLCIWRVWPLPIKLWYSQWNVCTCTCAWVSVHLHVYTGIQNIEHIHNTCTYTNYFLHKQLHFQVMWLVHCISDWQWNVHPGSMRGAVSWLQPARHRERGDNGRCGMCRRCGPAQWYVEPANGGETSEHLLDPCVERWRVEELTCIQPKPQSQAFPTCIRGKVIMHTKEGGGEGRRGQHACSNNMRIYTYTDCAKNTTRVI